MLKINMRNKTNKLANLERKRYSLFTDDLSRCIMCGNKKDHLHEIIYGKNRLNSIRYGLVLPLCANCHIRIHNDINLDHTYHILAQNKFNEVYPNLDFISIFHKDYIYLYNKKKSTN